MAIEFFWGWWENLRLYASIGYEETDLIPRSARDANGAPSGTDLSSGRYIMIESAREFTLVPWRPMLEHEFGREVSGIARGRTISWSFGRERDLSL